MGQFFKWSACWLLVSLGLVAVASAAAPRLSAGFLNAEIQPGELVEFEAKLDAETVATFKLKLPDSALLMPITTETGPLRFEDGRFLQVQRWVFQAVASGTVRWEPLVVQVMQAGAEKAYPLPAATLRIVPYAEADTSDRPQALPAPESAKNQPTGTGWRWLLVGLAVLTVCGGIGLVWKRWRARR